MAKIRRLKSDQPFWVGGVAASMAACFTHPLDQTKYRIQVLSTKQSVMRTLCRFASRDGIFSLWQGLSASILRQSTYSTTRLGLYNYLAQSLKASYSTQSLSTGATVACAGLAGGIAGLLGNPTELVLVRMCADGAKSSSQRFSYGNALSALVRIAREEGMRAFGKGLVPNVVRSVLMNVSQIAVYTTVKAKILNNPSSKMKDDMPTHIAASLVAGTAATTVCAPADVLKSRMQSSGSTGNSQALVKVLSNGLRDEGPRFLMKGWAPAWLRLAPNTILMFIFIEQLQRIVGSSV